LSKTSLEIRNKHFKKGILGLNEGEVNEYLAEVAEDYEKLLEINKEFREQNKILQEHLSHYENLDETLNKSIVIAIKTGEEAKRQAEKEAEVITKKAEQNAEKIINDALLKEKVILLEIEDLKKQSNVFRTRLKKLIEGHLELLDTETSEKLELLEVTS
jgi:cell division initiation protein